MEGSGPEPGSYVFVFFLFSLLLELGSPMGSGLGGKTWTQNVVPFFTIP
jgi:hypothetical protein